MQSQEALKESYRVTTTRIAIDGGSFDMLLAQYLEYAECELNYAKETLDTYEKALKRVKKYINQLDPRTFSMEDYFHMKSEMKKADLSANYVNVTISALRSFLIYCADIKKINLLINYKEMKKVKVPKREVIFLTEEERDKFTQAIKPDGIRGLRMRALVEFLLGTAMRISEALAFDRDIEWQLKGEALIIGKGDKQRAIYITERALEWVKKYLATRKDNNPALFVTFGDNPKRLQRYDLSKSFHYYATLAGITDKKITPHIMRHTAATILLQKGCPLPYIQELLGHSSIAVTAKYYLGTDKRSLKEAINKYLNY